MKYLSIYIFIVLSQTASVSAQPLEFNAKNLTMLALKHSSDDAISDYAKDLARSKHIKEYFKYIKDKEKRQELIERVKKELKTELASLSKDVEFSFSKTVNLDNINFKQQTFNVRGFTKDVEAKLRKAKKNIGLPEYFFLLYANLEILKNVKFNGDFEDKFNKKNKKETVFLQATLLLPAYQNEQEFQVVIKDIAVYSDAKKELLFARKSEKRPAKEIITSWLLSEGFTNKLVGIHAFSLYGYRLQDMLTGVIGIKKSCKKTNKIGIHQLVVCQRKHSENTILIGTYIGGKFAKLELIANKQPSQYEKDAIINQLTASLKQPKSFFNTKQQKWQKYGVDFEFHHDAFSTEGVLGSVFDFNNTNKQHGTIFSMMSQATKKLIEDSK